MKSHQSVHTINRSRVNGSECRANSHRAKRNISASGSIEGFYSLQSASIAKVYYQTRLVWLIDLIKNDCSLSFSAVVKTELGPEKICLKRERDNHRFPAIASCQYLRSLYDIVGPGDSARGDTTSTTGDPLCLVFEWMEHDLRTVPSDNFRENSILPKIIAKSILSALAFLKSQCSAIHTGGFFSSPKGQQQLNIKISIQTMFSSLA